MIKPYIDLHCHTNLSDGNLTPQELVDQARASGIRVLAITDHNYFDESIFNSLREQNPDIQFITGAEISCLYCDSMGQEHELHVPALGFDPSNEELKAVFAHNQPDRRPYVNRILDKLRDNSIDLGSYDEIKARYPDTKYIGLMAIARCMYEEGYTSSIDESFDIYLSAHGEARAYVKNPLRFVSLETAVSAILHAGGVATLGHLLYYRMDESENERLVKYFKSLTGDRGAIEVYYARYDAPKRLYLLQLSQKYGLMPSAASDYHAQEKWERLDNHFSYSVCGEILDCLGVQVDDAVPPVNFLVISGFSGAGKGTILKKIVDEKGLVNGLPIRVIVSVTTRDPRGPQDSYIFTSREHFTEMVNNGQFLEHNDSYSKQGYGTPISGVCDAVASGYIPCLEIDRVGLLRLLTDGKINCRNIRSVFVCAPAADVAKRLITGRTETKEAILRRLKTSREEASYVSMYDNVVVNSNLEEATEKVIRAFNGTVCRDEFNHVLFKEDMDCILNDLGTNTSIWRDPVESTAAYKAAMIEIRKRLDIEYPKDKHVLGICHAIWSRKKELLAADGIDWLTPTEMNPTVYFD